MKDLIKKIFYTEFIPFMKYATIGLLGSLILLFVGIVTGSQLIQDWSSICIVIAVVIYFFRDTKTLYSHEAKSEVKDPLSADSYQKP